MTDGDVAVLAYLNEHTRAAPRLIEESPTRIIVLEDAFQGDDELKTTPSDRPARAPREDQLARADALNEAKPEHRLTPAIGGVLTDLSRGSSQRM